MIKSDVMKLFAVIHKTYTVGGFKPGEDNMKLELWLDLLKDVPFELAQANLRQHILDAENKFPPHPGILAERPEASASGRAIPSAEETRRYFAEQDKLLPAGDLPPIPEHLREKVRKFGQPSDSIR